MATPAPYSNSPTLLVSLKEQCATNPKQIPEAFRQVERWANGLNDTVLDFFAYSQTTQNITSATPTVVNNPLCSGSAFGWDLFGTYNTSSSVCTIPKNGRYDFGGGTYLNAGTGMSQQLVSLFVNGAERQRLYQTGSVAGSGIGGILDQKLTGSAPCLLNQNDQVTLVYLAFGTGIQIGFSTSTSILQSFWGRYIGPV